MRNEVKRALAYRVGSFLLASVIAWGILAVLRGTTWSSAAISFFTSGFLQFTHFGYYILFHRMWGDEKEARLSFRQCREREYQAFKRGFERGTEEGLPGR